MTEQYVLDLRDVGEAQVALAGGKGANLGALLRLDGVRVPAGFCVTTEAFRRVVPAGLPDDPADIRRVIERAAVPADLAAAITARIDERTAYAVRSSATAEDLPGASFAGQQDTYLNVTGAAAVLAHVRRCWASLFTDRAVAYRRRHGIDDGAIAMAVVVQEMVEPTASGVLFTADPVTSNRTVAAVEAVPGLGEALVSGLVSPDLYQVRDDRVVSSWPGATLTDEQVVRLVRLGRRIEAHFGRPQDIEWCLDDDGFAIVQSRPITTLFPVPQTADGGNHVYLSVGHQQMMTDPMKPLGLSFWQMTTPAPMAEAGGRLFVDVTARLASAATRDGFLAMIGQGDPLTGDALRTLLDRGDFIRPVPGEDTPRPPAGAPAEPIEVDPAIVTGLITASEASVAAAADGIRGKTGEALLDFIEADLPELRRILFDPVSHRVFMSAMDAVWWLNAKLEEWLGERNAADTLTQSVPHNVTSEMGLALLDVADAIRPYPPVEATLADFPDRLPPGPRAAVESWLGRYGMRCPGEIDITRPRWAEEPSMLVPLLVGNVRNFEPGAAARRFERGRQEALAREHELLGRLRALPDGAARAAETKARIDRVRAYIGYREYPKYGMVSRYWVYKQALTAEAERLVAAGVLRAADDIHFLSFAELREVVRTGHADHALLDERRRDFRTYQTLTPPRVLTSDGEGLTGSYRRDGQPAGALSGLAASAGTVEGRARVVLDLSGADLEPGDILVTAFTDPSWTPLFVGIAGLVTEVGGMMTHGAVIAREYGLPAVVGLPGATRLIADGQRIRLDGGAGYVEILD